MKQCESCKERVSQVLIEFGDGAEYHVCNDCAFGVEGEEVSIREAILLICGFQGRAAFAN